MIIPDYVKGVTDKIEKAGYEAYVVGGCVRDSILGRPADDWDVAVSARPEEVTAALGAENVIPTGIKHGTVTAVTDGGTVELTTYRIDGDYADCRHPSSVTFTSDLTLDLERRDFTMNAVAYNPRLGIVDPFGGRADIERRVIRCVGDPEKRFREDALRIMRALRFSAVLGFEIDPPTAAAIHRLKNLLSDIAAERIAAELNKLMLAPDPSGALREYSDVVSVFIPELSACIGFDQKSGRHIYDVWEHMLHAVAESPQILPVRLALLFHDIAKPVCAAEDENGALHFRGHQSLGAEMASRIMRRLKYDNSTRFTVKMLVENHDIPIKPTRVSVRRALRRLGADKLGLLLEVKLADNLAKSSEYRCRIQEALDVGELMNDIIENGDCCTLAQLAVNGFDIKKSFDMTGKSIGYMLDTLLDAVINEKCPNEKDALLDLAREKFK